MPQDLILVVTLTIVGALIGAAIGLLLRRFRRSWCESWAKSCVALPWWVFAFSAIFFLLIAGGSFTAGRNSFGAASLGFVVLELFAMIMAIVRQRRIPNATTLGDDRGTTA